MRSKWKWTKRRTQVLRRNQVIRSWRRCRDAVGLTPRQTRLLLKGSADPRDLAIAEKVYNGELQTDATGEP